MAKVMVFEALVNLKVKATMIVYKVSCMHAETNANAVALNDVGAWQ